MRPIIGRKPTIPQVKVAIDLRIAVMRSIAGSLMSKLNFGGCVSSANSFGCLGCGFQPADLLPLNQLQVSVQGIQGANVRGDINQDNRDQGQDADDGDAALAEAWSVKRRKGDFHLMELVWGTEMKVNKGRTRPGLIC